MQDLLFLAHRIPYPPDKGDKIRSWNIFRHLAGRYRVHLGAFVDDPADLQHRRVLEEMSASCFLLPLDPRWAKLLSARGFVTGEALSFPYYRSRAMQAWVRQTLAAAKPAVGFAFSSQVAPYLLSDGPADMRRVIDFVDVDSDKWDQYAASKRFPMSWVYRREAAKLAKAEARLAGATDASLFVSEAEAELFRSRAPAVAGRVFGVLNGVDLDWFCADADLPNPYTDAPGPVLVFAGAMDYWANVDAVVWFADAVLPAIQAHAHRARFVICGAKPTAEVQALAERPGVVVTGRVEDIRPYVAHATISVAPLRIARGIQNKVLEAMALSRAIVCTPQALEGIDATPGRDLALAETAPAFAAAVIDLLPDAETMAALGRSARARVEAAYGWPAQMATLDAIIDGGSTVERRPHEETAA